MARYIYQYDQWPEFTWDDKVINVILGKVRHLQGKIMGQMGALGFTIKEEAILSTLTLDVLKSSEIEGEMLNYEQVRSSIARKLRIDYAGMVHSDRDVDGVVEMMLNATQKYNEPLDEERLFGWHAALFPTGWSGMLRIDTGCYRKDEMQIVSGPMGKEKVHYQAPSHELVKLEMDNLLKWINEEPRIDAVLKAAIAHFWFIIIHPFDDGNGRIGRILIPLFLVRRGSIVSPSLYISGYLETNRDKYYQCLENISNNGDWLGWIEFFLNAVINQSVENLKLVRKIINLYDQKKREISDLLHTDQAIYILDMLFDTPVFRANELHQRLNIQRQRAAQYIRILKDARIIVELRPSRGRKPALLSFEDLWKITDRQ